MAMIGASGNGSRPRGHVSFSAFDRNDVSKEKKEPRKAEPKYFAEIVPHPSRERANDIFFKLASGAAPLDGECARFKRELDSILSILRTSFPAQFTAQYISERLIETARTGLGGTETHPALALQDLEVCKQELAAKGVKLRSEYFRGLIKPVAWLAGAGLLLLVAWICGHVNQVHLAELLAFDSVVIDKAANAIGGFGFSLVGLGVGVFVATFIKSRDIAFEHLDRVANVYRFQPGEYVLILGAITLLLHFLLFFNAIQLGVGGVLLNDFTRMPPIGLLTGATCALGEAAIVAIVVKHTEARESEHPR